MPILHLIIPFLDEGSTLGTIVDRVQRCDWTDDWSARIVLVDDGSETGSAKTAQELAATHGITLLRHEVNRGKGAALRTGFVEVLRSADEHDLVGIQDADLEYDPADLPRLVEAMTSMRGPVDAVFGNRWIGERRSAIRRVHRLGNRTLTAFSNLLTGLQVSDMECCFKVIRVPMLRTMLPDLDEDRFAIEPQLAAALARHGARVNEVGVSYDPRSFAEGKKIGIGDAIAAVAAMIREWRRTRRFHAASRRGKAS